MFTTNLLSAYGWFAALLVIMIFITILFGIIVFIALKPIKKEKSGDNASTKKLLSRREAELTIELMNNEGDKKTKEDLIDKLRRVKAAEEVVDELVKEEKAVADELDAEDAKKKGKKPVKKRPAGQRPNGVKSQKPPQNKKPSKEFKPQVDLDQPEEKKAEPAKAEEAKAEDAKSEEKASEDKK